ncbi:MAG: 2-C-methyl-D-erythritol 2,4-cyclodiphosphate synthase [Oscillospiraceae bacterium]|nr:2-C-methyl-D-erythritol 2,4-cyclodiphosphate synthase [Oscillospiraceae bacterium]
MVLGGVAVDGEQGLDGHSDADVVVHAIMDALLGAAALGDIGVHFSPDDAQYKNIDSCVLLARVVALLREGGRRIGNIDTVIVAERPRLATYVPLMREKLASICRIDAGSVSVKATTEEGLGLAGKGIAAHCICTIVKDV